jgi:hypothetical protein
MRYTVARFEPEHHRPEPFLGRAVSLPELEGFPVATRHCLENPLLSREQVDVWTEAMEFFSNGYHQKLKPAHWGVFTARTLEAMFWRVLDMGPGPQTWHKGLALPSATKIQVYCESSLMHNLARDLTLTAYFASDDSATTASMEVPYPASTTQKNFSTKKRKATRACMNSGSQCTQPWSCKHWQHGMRSVLQTRKMRMENLVVSRSMLR